MQGLLGLGKDRAVGGAGLVYSSEGEQDAAFCVDVQVGGRGCRQLTGDRDVALLLGPLALAIGP